MNSRSLVGAPVSRRLLRPVADLIDRGVKSGRLRALDGLRLVAALMVAAYHYGGRGGAVSEAWGTSPERQFPTLHGLLAYGCLGVQFFFVISGFVICMSGWGRTPASFAAARLLPAYWAAVVLVAAVFALPVVPYDAVPPSDALVNLTMLQQPLGADRVLGVCWTLWVEVRCYAPFFVGGAGLYLGHRDRRDAHAWGIVAAGLLVGQHHAVRALWNASDPDAFAHRTVLGIVGCSGR